MDQNKIPHDPRNLGVPSSASKMIYEPMVYLAQTVHLSCIKICTNQNELSLEPRHLGVPLGAPKTISKPMVRSTQTVDLSCVMISTISKRTEMNLVTSEYHRVRPKLLVNLWHICRKQCTYLALTLTPSPNGPK
jgi:hypothetical protein